MLLMSTIPSERVRSFTRIGIEKVQSQMADKQAVFEIVGELKHWHPDGRRFDWTAPYGSRHNHSYFSFDPDVDAFSLTKYHEFGQGGTDHLKWTAAESLDFPILDTLTLVSGASEPYKSWGALRVGLEQMVAIALKNGD